MRSLSHILCDILEHGGFLSDLDVEVLAETDRLRQVLVRCNGCRFTCAAQDVKHLTAIVEASKVDWVRDVSLLSSDAAYSGDFSPRTVDGDYKPATLTTMAKGALAALSQPAIFPADVAAAKTWLNYGLHESSEYSGSYDGFSVTSDADPGL